VIDRARTAFERFFVRLQHAVYLHVSPRIGHRMTLVPSLVLRTTGRRSGLERAVVLPYATDGGGYVVVASNWGRDQPPAWLVNLRAAPRAEVQIARRRERVEARIVESEDPEHARLWRLANENNHHRYEGYVATTDRPIAIAVLLPAPN
jgi:deazaflavin-dependent oxidoreductase (nitroreductase family)